MSIYEANSIPPRSQRLRLLTYFSLARHPGTDNNFEYIEKYPALPSPTLSKRTSDAPPRSIILSARQSPRDRGEGGWEGIGDRIGRIPIMALRQTARFSAIIFDILHEMRLPQLMRARARITHKVAQKPPCLPSSPLRIDSNKN